MYFHIKTSKYISRKRSNLYMFLLSINKNTRIKDESDLEKKIELWCNYKNHFKKLRNKIKMEIIKKKDNFIIYRERYTNSWFLKCKNVISFYISKNKLNDINDTLNEIKDMYKYTFSIYETNYHYIFFCTSHFSYEIDSFLKRIILDYSDKRILIMHLNNNIDNICSFVFLNNYLFDENKNIKKISVPIPIVSKVPFRTNKSDCRVNENKNIINMVNIIIEYITVSKNLPSHCFPIN